MKFIDQPNASQLVRDLYGLTLILDSQQPRVKWSSPYITGASFSQQKEPIHTWEWAISEHCTEPEVEEALSELLLIIEHPTPDCAIPIIPRSAIHRKYYGRVVRHLKGHTNSPKAKSSPVSVLLAEFLFSVRRALEYKSQFAPETSADTFIFNQYVMAMPRHLILEAMQTGYIKWDIDQGDVILLMVVPDAKKLPGQVVVLKPLVKPGELQYLTSMGEMYTQLGYDKYPLK